MDRQGRQPRIHVPNSIHHVMVRGNNRQRIFYGADCFNYFLDMVSQSTEKFDHKILAYCLMSNHAHLLIHIHDSSLSSVMQKINYRYARWFNHKQKCIGHLFQGRYRSLDVDNEEYLVNLCRYIHFNPVAAKIVNELNDYVWSSHHYYVKNNFPVWMDSRLMLSAIKNKTNLNYTDFMTQPVDRETWTPAIYISEMGDIIHNEDMLRFLQKEKVNPNKLINQFLTEEQVSTIVCRELNISKTALLGSSKNPQLVKKRILLINYLLHFSNINITGAAKLFQRTHGTLSRQLEKFSLHPKKYFPNELLKNIEKSLSDKITNI